MSCCGNELTDPESKSEPARTGTVAASHGRDVILLVIAAFIAGTSTLATVVFNLSEMTDPIRWQFQTGLLVSTIVVAALLAPQLFRNVLTNVRRRSISVDLLFLLGCVGAMGYSLFAFGRGGGAVYFEVFSILLVIYCLGAWVKRRTQQSVWSSLDAWSPNTHRCRVSDSAGGWTMRVVADVGRGDVVQVPAGAMVPVDGEVVRGAAFVRESTITGEPHVRHVEALDRVFASSVVVDAPIEVRATADGNDRLIDRISSIVDAARLAPSRWQMQADRIARWFTPLVATASIATLTIWLWRSDVSTAIMVALSVLLVACPCAFGFATPVSIWVTISRLASRSLIVTRADVIERLASVDTVVFDKTGTLTVLEPKLTNLLVRSDSEFSEEQILSFAGSIETHSQHPIASVFLATPHSSLSVESTESIPAVGVRGRVEFGGRSRTVEVGRLDQLHRPCCDGDLLARVHNDLEPSQQAIAIRIDGDLQAVAIVGEAAIDTLAEGLAHLKTMGLAVRVFSGDRGERVRDLGIEWASGGMSPEDKMNAIKHLRGQGQRVLFIGDGVNDAAAMSEADASISVASGSGLAIEASDVVWHGHDLRNISAGIQIARRSVLRLRRALVFAITYNTLGMIIAASGWLHPVVAILLMLGSSLTVVFHAADMGWEGKWTSGLLPIQNRTPPEPLIAANDATRTLVQINLRDSTSPKELQR